MLALLFKSEGECMPSNHDARVRQGARPHLRIVATGTPARRPYVRARDLPAVLAAWPREIADMSLAGTERIVVRLRLALRRERRRGASGHWSYDLGRHAGLRQALIAEEDRLASLRRGGACAASPAPDSA